MKVITVSNQKGGVGKSTLAIHFAHYALEQDLRVLFIDMDSQGNSSTALMKEFPQLEAKVSQMLQPGFKLAEFKIPAGIRVIQGDLMIANFKGSGSAFTKNLEAMRDDWDVCVIDTGPTASLMQVLPLSVADFVISPIELSEWSYEGSIPFLRLLQNLRASTVTGKPKFLGLLPNRVMNVSTAQIKEFKKLVDNSGFKAKMFNEGDCYIPMKQCYLETAKTGQPVWYQKTSSSAREEGRNIKTICGEILRQIYL